MVSMSSVGPFPVSHVAAVLLLPPTVQRQWWCYTNVTEGGPGWGQEFCQKGTFNPGTLDTKIRNMIRFFFLIKIQIHNMIIIFTERIGWQK